MSTEALEQHPRPPRRPRRGGARAGLDGLQHVSKTVVFGELDWSPQVHEQAIGRVARDGQTEPVFAYFLHTETGSDPTMRDVAEVKHMQLVGVRDPLSALVEEAELDPDHIKKLAQAYLDRAGKRATT